MKNLKSYQFDKVQYGYSLKTKGWEFKVSGPTTFTLVRHCKGSEVAHKVAHIVNGSFKRVGQLDNLARANIDRLTIV
jgi:hypothetical protein